MYDVNNSYRSDCESINANLRTIVMAEKWSTIICYGIAALFFGSGVIWTMRNTDASTDLYFLQCIPASWLSLSLALHGLL